VEEIMSFVRIETSDEDIRWINLSSISRVTIGKDETGVDLMVAVFADGDVDDALTIRGTDDVNNEAILEIERALNQHCE
jgi:hypothetical protein